MSAISPDSAETSQLLVDIESGNGEFNKLFARHRRAIKAAVELRLDRRLRARLDASDVVQDAQTEAFRRMNDFLKRRPMPFHLWLRKMAMERLIMARRFHLDAQRRAAGRELALPGHSTLLLGRQLLADDKSPSQKFDDHELAERVRVAVAELPDHDREILLMRNFEGLSYDEIACLLEIDSAAARKRNGRALIRLHKLLHDRGISESQI